MSKNNTNYEKEYWSKVNTLRNELKDHIKWINETDGKVPYEEKKQKFDRMYEIAKELNQLDTEYKKYLLETISIKNLIKRLCCQKKAK